MPSMRWSLASMFVATALVAAAAYTARLGFAGDPPYILAVPVFLGAAVGVLAGNVIRNEPSAAVPPKRKRRWYLNGVFATAMFLAGSYVCIYTLAFASMIDPRIEGFARSKAVFAKVFAQEPPSGLVFCVGLAFVGASCCITVMRVRNVAASRHVGRVSPRRKRRVSERLGHVTVARRKSAPRCGSSAGPRFLLPLLAPGVAKDDLALQGVVFGVRQSGRDPRR